MLSVMIESYFCDTDLFEITCKPCRLTHSVLLLFLKVGSQGFQRVESLTTDNYESSSSIVTISHHRWSYLPIDDLFYPWQVLLSPERHGGRRDPPVGSNFLVGLPFKLGLDP